MTTQTIEGEIMTDFQFKALMLMVLEIVEKSKDLEEVKQAIKKLATGELLDESKDK
jgi:hypothetical protein